MTDIYCAFSVTGKPTFRYMAERGMKCNLLVSYYYLRDYERSEAKVCGAKLMLDSGAFSAWKSGKSIDIDKLIEETLNPRWGDTVSLDVIGDAEASARNCEYMRSRGSKAYPVFHIGDPWSLLDQYCSIYPKLGLSCRFGEAHVQSMRWLEQCFRRCWPHLFHSFGWVKEDMLMEFPFHSADTSSWINGRLFGNWKGLGAHKMKVPGSKALLVADMEFYAKLERRLKEKWHLVLEQVSSSTSAPVPSSKASKPSPDPKGRGRRATSATK